MFIHERVRGLSAAQPMEEGRCGWVRAGPFPSIPPLSRHVSAPLDCGPWPRGEFFSTVTSCIQASFKCQAEYEP